MAELNARIIAKASATAAEEPLTGDLEVAELAVNTADGKLFTKHTDGSVVTISGGGGGAVDSVNGEIGVVSLGIQDMDDFELVPLVDGTYELSDKVGGTSGNSDVLCWNVHSEGIRIFLSPDETFLKGLLSSGDEITLSVPGLAEPHVATLTTDVVPPDTGDWLQFDLSPAITAAEILNAADGTPLTISSSALIPGFQTLADGDILQWNDTDQKFKPAQPSGGGGAVDSVNTQTGVVSLGIQDMDDFGLEVGAPRTGIWNEEWPPKVQGQTDEFPDLPGEWASYDSAGDTYLFVAATDSEGTVVDVADVIADPTSYGITIVVNGVAEPRVQLTGALIQDSGLRYRFDWLTADLSANSYGEVYDNDNPVASPGPYYNTLEVYFSPWSSPSYIPLAEGDILQWVDADQKFKPAQLPTGGSGAVDSVNGETGTVSLGIQDMDDFALNQILPSTVFFFDIVEQTANPSGDGESRIFSSGTRLQMYQTDANGADYGSAQAAASLANGSVFNVPIWTKCDDEPWVEHTSSSIPATTSSAYWSVDSLSPATSSYDGQNVTTLSVTFTAPVGAQDIPLAEGDILQWNDLSQKFKPAQLPDPIVDSVNGEIGAVSLGIQDMDDFELAYPPGSATVFQYDTIFDNSNPNNTGQVRVWFSGTRLQVNEYDSIGNASFIDAAIAAKTVQPTSTPIWTKGDNNAWVEHVGTIGTDPGGDGGYISITDISPAIIGTESTLTTFYISFGAPATNPLPLAEGDVLQWSNVDQKFRPAQLPAGGGAVDSVNGETGVVSLGIQDMDDYELNPVAVVFLLYSDWSDGGSFADPGSAGAYATGNVRFIGNYEDSNGVDAQAYFEDAISRAGGNSMPVWISPDGITWTEKAADNVSGSTNGATRFEITSSLTAIAPISGPIYVSFYDMNAVAEQPLAEGDILQWNSADQKFKPAQLPDATATRTLLGIGEYVDDAAAGTGGLTSGAMYYNTTSSDYRLKS